MKTRIRTTKQVKLSEIQPHPENPNQGDTGAILESLEANDQFRAIGVSEMTGNIVYGNHTYLAAEMRGETSILTHLLPDLSSEDELRIMTADNAIAHKASYDDVSLAELLLQLQATDRGLIGTGFDDDDLQMRLTDLDTSMFLPSGDEPPRLDQTQQVECPSCGKRFSPMAHVTDS